MFDIVIPLGPNEIKNIDKQIEYTKKNIIGYRNIYIVTKNANELQINDCKMIDENVFPFKKEDIASYFAPYNCENERNGWYLQQLLKLYVSFIIDELLDNYLIIDADAFFLKPTEFIKDNNKYIFTTGNEYHIPYFQHMKRLHPTLKKSHKKSGIAHHMLFNRNILKELFYLVESYHNKQFWRVFIETVKDHNNTIPSSGCSEYEIYFTYMILNHSEKIIIRDLKWENKSKNYKITQSEQEDFVSICSWFE